MPSATPLLSCDIQGTSGATLAREGRRARSPDPLGDVGPNPSPGGPLRKAQVDLEGEGNPDSRTVEEGDDEYQCSNPDSSPS